MDALHLSRVDGVQGPIVGLWRSAFASAMSFGAAPFAGLGRLIAGQTAVAEREVETATVAGASAILAQALREDSNLEVDWLWYATKVASGWERHYCLRRALRINPSSQIARRELSRLPRR